MAGRGAALIVSLLLFAGCGTAALAPPPANPLDDARQAIRMLDGLRQDGFVLGAADAPATLVVYASMADLDGQVLRRDLPEIKRQYLGSGRVKVLLRTVTGGGGQSPSDVRTAQLARLTQGAGLQDRLWDFFLALGYTGGSQVDRALSLVEGLDPDRARRDARSQRVRDAIARADAMARKAGVAAELPAFFLQRGDGPLIRLDADCRVCLLVSLEGALAGPAPTFGQPPDRDPAPPPVVVPVEPVVEPTATPETPEPTPQRTPRPTPEPTPEPTSAPTAAPTPEPEPTESGFDGVRCRVVKSC